MRKFALARVMHDQKFLLLHLLNLNLNLNLKLIISREKTIIIDPDSSQNRLSHSNSSKYLNFFIISTKVIKGVRCECFRMFMKMD